MNVWQSWNVDGLGNFRRIAGQPPKSLKASCMPNIMLRAEKQREEIQTLPSGVSQSKVESCHLDSSVRHELLL